MDYNWDTLLCLLRATLLLVHFKWRGPLTALWESSLAWPSPLSSDQPSRHWPHSQTLVCGQWLPSPVCLATHTKGRERKQAKANQTLCISSQLHSLTIRRKESQDLIKLVILIQNHSNVSENNLEPAVLKQGTHSTPVHSVCVRYVSPHLQTSAALTCSQKRKLIQIKRKNLLLLPSCYCIYWKSKQMKFSLLCQRYLFSLKKRLLLNYGSSWEGFQRFCQISNLMGGYVSVAGLCLFYEWRMKFMFVVNKNQDYQIEEKKSSKNTEIAYV